MTSLKNLTSGQLQKMLLNTEAEIKRREYIQAATAEIKAVLKKYKIAITDVDLQALHKKADRKIARKSGAPSKERDNRKSVKPKFSNPNGPEKWSGRGRAPAWVLKICKEKGIELATFKEDGRFTDS